MSINQVREKLKSETRRLGRRTMAALYPKEFDYAMITLELIDSDFKTVEAFTFPIMPENMSEDETTLVNVVKTFGGVVSIDNSTFNPTNITISGTFGRDIKIIVNKKPFQFAGVQLNFKNRKLTADIVKKDAEFISFAKTGHGCVQILKSFAKKQNQLDDQGRPYFLVMYAPILNMNYIIKINSIIQSMNNDSNNLIPRYDLLITSLAPIESIGRNEVIKRLQNLAISEIQGALNDIAISIRKSLKK